MQRTPSSRKRAAPGASPMMQQPVDAQNNFDFTQLQQNTDYPAFDFTQFPVDQSYQDQSLNDPNSFAVGLNGSQAPTYGSSALVPNAAVSSTDLVRRSRNQQIAPQYNGQQEQRNGYSGGAGGGNGMTGQAEEEDEQELERRVALAKRDAQGKRKQIPPFVQKLSSFLDSGNTELIRWADDGRSFIVIDEDEFARTLIPELFKHNNYASFVRQLNMYGFHKTVNITDGSLRQSEKARKGVKPPSMYSHPYFRRNRPDLLWLIQKPTAKSGVKRKRDGTIKADDSDDEHNSPGVDGRPLNDLYISGAGRDVAPLPRGELSSVRRELADLKTSQMQISKMILQLQEQNHHFIEQANQFQQLHNRHETSINAILTFLATFYNRSLEGHAGQNLMNMFGDIGQKGSMQPPQQQGSVVEDFSDVPPMGNNQVQRFKRPQLLLHGPTGSSSSPLPQPGSAHTAPASARSSASPINDPRSRTTSGRASSAQPATTSASPQVKTDALTPDMLQALPESDEMMSLINSVNATNASTPSTAAPAMDFHSALDHYQTANGNAPLTPQQRDDMLALIANQQGTTTSNNALMSPTPPAMPDLNQLREQQQQLEMLTNMQKAQDARVSELNRRLQPLSPTGTIPGMGDGGSFFDPTGAPGDFDPNSFINFDNDNDLDFDFNEGNDNGVDWDFGNPGTTGIDGGGEMFAMPATAQQQSNGAVLRPEQGFDSGGRVESVSSGATSPAVTEAEDPADRKRARRS